MLNALDYLQAQSYVLIMCVEFSICGSSMDQFFMFVCFCTQISAGNSPSPTSDREDGKKKSEQSGFLNRFRHFKRSVSKDAAANLSDGKLSILV